MLLPDSFGMLPLVPNADEREVHAALARFRATIPNHRSRFALGGATSFTPLYHAIDSINFPDWEPAMTAAWKLLAPFVPPEGTALRRRPGGWYSITVGTRRRVKGLMVPPSELVLAVLRELSTIPIRCVMVQPYLAQRWFTWGFEEASPDDVTACAWPDVRPPNVLGSSDGSRLDYELRSIGGDITVTAHERHRDVLWRCIDIAQASPEMTVVVAARGNSRTIAVRPHLSQLADVEDREALAETNVRQLLPFTLVALGEATLRLGAAPALSKRLAVPADLERRSPVPVSLREPDWLVVGELLGAVVQPRGEGPIMAHDVELPDRELIFDDEPPPASSAQRLVSRMSKSLAEAAQAWLCSADTESASSVENHEWAFMGLAVGYLGSESLASLPPAIRVVFSTWLLEADVANGGWAQAALNRLETFDLAAVSYEELGRPDLADLVRRAKVAMLAEQKVLEQSAAAEHMALTEYLQNSTMRAFDEESARHCGGETSWTWATPERLRYAREHASELKAFGPASAG